MLRATYSKDDRHIRDNSFSPNYAVYRNLALTDKPEPPAEQWLLRPENPRRLIVKDEWHEM